MKRYFGFKYELYSQEDFIKFEVYSLEDRTIEEIDIFDPFFTNENLESPDILVFTHNYSEKEFQEKLKEIEMSSFIELSEAEFSEAIKERKKRHKEYVDELVDNLSKLDKYIIE
ncbi:hypothetical protein ACQ1R0_03805 [Ornithobacterium rhinotracheale]|uniref:hypothetical protein n=1 Tax=Ornithobacterium rhinotracheale TaxID=28251 RepID=UPI00403A2D76